MIKYFLLILIVFITSVSSSQLTDYKRAKKLYRQQKYTEAARYFKSAAGPGSPVRDFACYYLAELSCPDVAVGLYRQLLSEYPHFPLKNSVTRKLSDLDFDRQDSTGISTDELWQKLQDYQQLEDGARMKKAARQLLLRNLSGPDQGRIYFLLANLEQDRNHDPQALQYFQNAAMCDPAYAGWVEYETLKRETGDDREELIRRLEVFCETYAGKSVAQAAHERLLKLYWKTDRTADLKSAYPQYMQRYPSSGKLAESWYHLGRLYDNEQNTASANECYARALTFKTSIRFKQENQYRLANTFTRLGRPAQAQRLLEQISSENAYHYYWFVAQRELDRDPLLKAPGISSPSRWESRIPRVKLFLALKDVEDALIVAKHYRNQKNRQNDQSLALYIVSLYERSGNYRGAITFSESVLADYERQGRLAELSAKLWQKSYPLYFKEIVFPVAQKFDVDPLLVLALIREESRFLNEDVSWANAHGLMQLLPETARDEATRSGIPWGDLRDPAFNIKVGVSHLAYLLSAYKNNFSYALAAYNGGINATNRWIQQTKGLPEPLFTERITFSETRLYVKKVLGSYWNYKQLYGRVLQASSGK